MSKYILIDTTERNKKRLVLIETTQELAVPTYTNAIKQGKIVDKIENCEDVITSIQELLDRNHTDKKDIDLFIPNPGPGSFTGIKIAITIANTLNWVLKGRSTKEAFKPTYGREPNITKPKEKRIV